MKIKLPLSRKELTHGIEHELPLIPLGELIVFPRMVFPFFAAKEESIKAIEAAMAKDRLIFLGFPAYNKLKQKSKLNQAAEKNYYENEADKLFDDSSFNKISNQGINRIPSQTKNKTGFIPKEDFLPVGTVAKILQMLKLPDGTLRILAEGRQRGAIKNVYPKKETSFAQVELVQEAQDINNTIIALMQAAKESYLRHAKYQKKVAPEIITSIEKAEYPDKMADLICANSSINLEKKAHLLSIQNTEKRMETLIEVLEAENEILGLQNKITNRVKQKLERSQKDYFLNEQLKQINKELGKEEDDPTGCKELEERIKAANLPEEVFLKAEKELKRLQRLQPMSPESGVLRTYLEWLVDLPWKAKSQDNRDIELAEKILNEDHYNMDKAKQRVLDFIAVRQLRENAKGPILCFIGPPGTGKTSLGRSVARALNRNFIRISLGGVRDEAEIRGHRKTYVGALPGKILQSMKKAETVNPVFLLDEIDKLSSDFRGDPASALLEVLDPEQNCTFMDHYMEVPYDLSSVMFITTANSTHTIPPPLRDRMEIIEVPGYTDLEKEKIASQFIIPKQIKENGLDFADIIFQKPAILEIIRSYTKESGVRNLEREIAGVIRKIAREAVKKGALPPEENEKTVQPEKVAQAAENAHPEGPAKSGEADISGGPNHIRISGKTENSEEAGNSEETEEKDTIEKTTKKSKHKTASFKAVITQRSLKKYLGHKRYDDDLVYRKPHPGLAHGLAWTEMGGKLLPVEVALLKGKGELLLTGSLGDVMKESAHLSISFLKAHYKSFRLDPEFQHNLDIHIHVPQGAIPKDGPSAGITLTAAILSALKDISLSDTIAMTGEITLTGKLLAIGGVKEKVLAAYRNKMKQVILPEQNRTDTDEMPNEVKNSLEFLFAGTMKEALLNLFPKELFDQE